MNKESENKMDDEADTFARCILMPEQMFRDKFFELVSLNSNLHKIAVELGKMFQVETTQAAIRIAELKLHNRTTKNKIKKH